MSGPSVPAPGTSGQPDRRSIWIAALALIIALLGGVLLVALLSDPTDPPDPGAASSEQIERPRIITEPNSGQEPQNPGDRGGWEQLLILALVMGAIVCIGVIVFRGGGAKAKANREAWQAAALSDHDGAIDD